MYICTADDVSLGISCNQKCVSAQALNRYGHNFVLLQVSAQCHNIQTKTQTHSQRKYKKSNLSLYWMWALVGPLGYIRSRSTISETTLQVPKLEAARNHPKFHF